jgi:PhnB protein
MQVQPYLFFDGRCEEALDVYRKALGAEVTMLLRFKDSPEPPPPGAVAPGSEHKVMHASVRIGETTIMASDGSAQGRPSFQGFSLSITVPDEARADDVFTALAEGGTVQMPLAKTFWSPRFGMLTDRFGVGWMVGMRRTTTFTTPNDRELVATRVFDAPRAVVWDAFTSPKHVPHWMLGPEGWSMPGCEIDLRPNGAWHFTWRMADGSAMEMRGQYKEVAEPGRLVSTESWGGDWPETLNTFVLTEENGTTRTVTTVLYPSREARARAEATGMKEGWAQSYDRLDQYLATLR